MDRNLGFYMYMLITVERGKQNKRTAVSQRVFHVQVRETDRCRAAAT